MKWRHIIYDRGGRVMWIIKVFKQWKMKCLKDQILKKIKLEEESKFYDEWSGKHENN